MSRYTVKVGLAVQIMSRYTGRGLQNLTREAESTDDRMSDSRPKIQNKFILIIIWSGDNKTQRNTARERIHAHRYTHRGKRKDVLQCCWKRVTNRAPNEFFGTFYHTQTKHAGVTKHAGRTSQYDTGWQNTVKRPIFNIPGASSARWCTRGIPKVGKIQGDGRKFLDRFKSYFGSQYHHNH